MGFLLDTQATRSALMSVDTTLAANIDATQDYIPVASTANFSTSVVAEVESTNEVVSFSDISSNRLLYSQDFDNAWWSKGNSSISANAGIAPDGTTTADKLIVNSGAQIYSICSVVNDVIVSTDNTLSCYAKPDGFNYLNLVQFTVTGGSTQGVQFNISTGVITDTQSATGTITDAGNGWYRCSMVPDTRESTQASIQVNDGAAPGTWFFTPVTGDGSKGILIWGAQLEATAITGYLPTTSAALVGLTGVTRGANGTTAASATSGDAIQQLPYALLNVDMPVRLTGLSVSSDGTGAGRLTLCDNNGDTLCDVDIPDTKIFDLDLGGGIVFPNGIFISNSDNITAYTLFTDEYSGTQ